MPAFITPHDLKPLVGQEIAASDWVAVTQDMIDAFATVTGDQQWIHVDIERARRESRYGTTIAHGFLTLALVSRLHLQSVQIGGVKQTINYGLNRLRFPAAVPAGSMIRTRSELLKWDEVGDTVQLTWTIRVDVQGQDKPALVADWVLRHYLNERA
ncbi:MAG: MaoC family dehydratase [Gemmataceae bacterium]|nr:MaoC family dehydratase [Gemmataceae bacterium]